MIAAPSGISSCSWRPGVPGRTVADDLRGRWPGGGHAGRERLFRHAADLVDRVRLDDDGAMALHADAAPGPQVRVLRRRHLRRGRCRDRGLRDCSSAPSRSFSWDPISPASICRRTASTDLPPPTRPRSFPAQGDLLRHGGRSPVRDLRPAVEQAGVRRNGHSVLRHLCGRHRHKPHRHVPVPPARSTKEEGTAATKGSAPEGRSRLGLLRNPTILVAIICSMISYALMNL